jgi:V/A-type H+/Na+-transporting ATPase subunit I
MIVKMRRLTLLCLTADRDAALEELRALGLVHVSDRRPPAGDELEMLRDRLADVERALAALPEKEPEEPVADAPRRPEDVVAEVLSLLDRRESLTARDEEVRRELARYAGYGEFDLDAVRELQRAGVWAILAAAPGAEPLDPSDGVLLVELGREGGTRYVVLLLAGGTPATPPDLGTEYDVVPWPERPLPAIRDELAATAAETEETERRLAILAAARPEVARLARATADAKRFAEVRAGMDEAGELSVLSGHVPADEQEAVRSAAAAHGWGVLLDDPEPGDDVPIQLRQSRWVKPVRVVFDFLHIYPGYWEWDVGWVFLPFFSLFFAMIVGDAGYAVLLLILTAVLQWRLKKVPPYVFHMMYIVGGVTLLWGVLTGSYFGIPTLPRFAESLQVAWLANRDNLIDLCFLIGAVHLSIAHVWNAVSFIRDGVWSKVAAQVGWLIFLWSMFFLARQAVLGRSMPGYLLYGLAVSIVLVALFMKTPREAKTEWIDLAMLPLTFIGSFVDILSYIRLFAVGYASVAVLAAFNDMAASIGFDSVFTAVAASVLLLFANALNIVLAGLGVLVHAVRLNTLEFSTHKGLAWQGHNLYTPFAKRREAA